MLKEKAVLGGAVGAAFMASLCCITPLIFVLLGIGSLGIAAVFEPLRPYLMAAAVLLLVFAYYWVYFRSGKANACDTGEECAEKPTGKASRFGLWIATFAVILFALTPYITASITNRVTQKQPVVVGPSDDECCLINKGPKTETAAAENNQPLANAKQVTFAVTGMTCATCEIAIRLALQKAPGVKRVVVSFEKQNAVVDFDPKAITPEKIRDVINETGYKVKE